MSHTRRPSPALDSAATFPWRSGNRFKLLQEGRTFFADVLQAIEAAEHSIRIEVYVFESGHLADRVIESLCAAATRSVPVQLLLDAVGSQKLNDADRERLAQSGVSLSVFNRFFPHPQLSDIKRDHRKMFIIDERVAYVGGACITDGYWDPVRDVCDWHDLMLRVTGPVVGDCVTLFDFRWNRLENGYHHPHPGRFEQVSPGLHDGCCRLGYTSGLPHKGLVADIAERIRSARRRVWMVTPYFFPVEAIAEALYEAAERGVDVQLFLAGEKTDHPWVREAGRGFFGRFIERDVTIYELDDQMLHAKVLVADNWLSVGSCNLDVWGANRNLQANLDVYDAGCLEQFESLFADYRTRFRRVSAEDWYSRSAGKRVSQAVFHFVGATVRRVFVRRQVD